MLLIIILRGHIRDALTNKTLFEFLKLLDAEYDVRVHLHTWDISQSSSSWRNIKHQSWCVPDFMIYEYFDTLKFSMHIDEEEAFQKTNPYSNDTYIGKTKMSMRAYYQYVYNLFQSLTSFDEREFGAELNDCICISMRVDYFANCSICYPKNDVKFFHKVKADIHQHMDSQKQGITLLSIKVGCDNYIRGKYSVLKKMFRHLYDEYNAIMQRHQKNVHQEVILKHEFAEISKIHHLYIDHRQHYIFYTIVFVVISIVCLKCFLKINFTESRTSLQKFLRMHQVHAGK